MLEQLIALFRGEGPGRGLREDLDGMIRLSAELVELAGDAYFGRASTGESRDLFAEDKKINKLQRQIRKDALLRAVASEDGFDLPFCLSLMNVVKDVERIGDYAKDIARLAEKAPPEDASAHAHLALETEQLVASLAAALAESDQLETVRLIDSGKDLRKRINVALFAEVESAAAQAARRALCLQYYQRVASHALNVLSTVVTPLHKMDYTGKRNLLPEVKAKLSAESESVEPV